MDYLNIIWRAFVEDNRARMVEADSFLGRHTIQCNSICTQKSKNEIELDYWGMISKTQEDAFKDGFKAAVELLFTGK